MTQLTPNNVCYVHRLFDLRFSERSELASGAAKNVRSKLLFGAFDN